MRKRELYRMCGAQSVVCCIACIACIAKTLWSLVCPGRTGRGKDLWNWRGRAAAWGALRTFLQKQMRKWKFHLCCTRTKKQLKIHGRTSCKVVFAISFYEKTCGWKLKLSFEDTWPDILQSSVCHFFLWENLRLKVEIIIWRYMAGHLAK